MLLDLRGVWPPRRLGSLRGAPGGPLAPYYGTGPGRIAIHFDTDHTTLDAQGRVIALQNRGGAGAYFDAAVSGAAIPVSGKALQMTAAGGVPILANTADLQGVRFMAVISTAELGNGMRFFGGPSTTMRIWNYGGGGNPFQTGLGFERTGSTAFGSNRFNLSRAGLHLIEAAMDYAAGTTTIWLDGAIVRSVDGATEVGVVANAFPDFLIDRIGQGATGSAPFVGLMGDVLGITLGAGSATAIAAARAYLAARHGVVLA